MIVAVIRSFVRADSVRIDGYNNKNESVEEDDEDSHEDGCNHDEEGRLQTERLAIRNSFNTELSIAADHVSEDASVVLRYSEAVFVVEVEN